MMWKWYTFMFRVLSLIFSWTSSAGWMMLSHDAGQRAAPRQPWDHKSTQLVPWHCSVSFLMQCSVCYTRWSICAVSAQLLNPVRLSATPWTVAPQVPLSMGFSRLEYWNGFPCPPPGDLPDPGIELTSYALQTIFTNWATGKRQSIL